MKFLVLLAVCVTASQAIHPLLVNPLIKEGFPPAILPIGQNPQYCADMNFKYCQVRFNTDLNITDTNDWTNVMNFWNDISTYYTSDLRSGLLTLCWARTRFQQCLGSIYPVCMDPFNFMRHGLNQTMAFQYVATFKMLEFECNGGNIQVTKNWPCMWSVYNSTQYANAQTSCTNSYFQAVSNGTNYCVAGANYVNCMSFVFLQFDCSKNVPEMRWFECERIRTAFQIEGGCPSLSCSTQVFGQSGLVIPEVEEHIHQSKMELLKRFAHDHPRRHAH